MARPIRLNEDIRGVTELRDILPQVVDRVVETKRPMIITRRSRPVAAIVDIDELQALYDLAEELEALEVKQIVDEFEAAEARGEAHITSHEEVVRLASDMIARAKSRA
ncbi:MAG: type II toxin-antitoxin system Phd/YefM family antitoxin [Chloroflexi bacterium]|nr:type II toxin-antitoxin system Phd/YefM family antitoxin [Chloroflexota bacterium]